MTINLSRAINHDNATVVVVEQPTASRWNDGEPTDVRTTEFTALAVVHTPTDNEAKSLPEGEWSDDLMIFTLNKPVGISSDLDERNKAVINFNGMKYRAIKRADWTVYGHNSIIGVRFE